MGLLGNFVVGGMSSALVATAMGNDPMQAFIIGGGVAAFNHFMHDKPKPKKLPAAPKYDANFHGHGLEPVYIEFDVISLEGTLKAGYYGLKEGFALTISPIEKSILKWSILKTTTSRGGEGYLSGFMHKASNFRFNIHAHNIKGYLKVPHINFGKNGEWHIIWDSNIAKKWGYIFKGEK